MRLFSRIAFFAILLSVMASGGAYAAGTAEILFTGQPFETVSLDSNTDSLSVNAQVRLNFGALPAGLVANELFKVSLSGEQLVIGVVSSGKVLVTAGSPEIQNEREGDVLKITAQYKFSFRDLALLNRALEMGFKKVLLKDGKLFFEAAPDLFELGFAFRFTVTKERFLRPDRMMYDLPLAGVSFMRNPTEDGRVLYWAEFSDLGLPVLSRGIYNFSLPGELVFPGESVLNRGELLRNGRLTSSVRRRAKRIFSRKN